MLRFLLKFIAVACVATGIASTAISTAEAAPPPGWTYLGCFKVPDIQAAGGDPDTYKYSAPVMAFDAADNGLYLSGKFEDGRVGKITTPAPSLTTNKNNLPRATVLQTLNNVIGRLPNQPFNDPRVGGLLVDGGALYGSAYSYYEGRADFTVSHFKFASNNVSSAVTGLFAVGALSQQPFDIAGGYMARIPASQQADYGGVALTGLAAVPIISGSSLGPAVSVFNPSAIGTSPYAPTTPLVYYTESHATIGPWAGQSTTFNGTTELKGVMMEEDGDVLCFGSQGTGPWSYKGPPDARNFDTQAAPYRYQLWHYTKADLLSVKNGVKQPWQITPTIYPVTLNFQTSACFAGGMAHDLATGKVYIAAAKCDGTMPIIHVFQTTASPQPPADTTPPVLWNIQVASVTETTATVTWTTDEASDSRIEYGPTTAYGTILVDQADVTSHSLTLTGLTAGTLYNFRVKSWDVANNSATSLNHTLTTASPPDPCAAIIAERDALLLQVSDLQAQVAALTTANTDLAQQVAALQSQLAALQTELDAANQKIANAKAALE